MNVTWLFFESLLSSEKTTHISLQTSTGRYKMNQRLSQNFYKIEQKKYHELIGNEID